MTVNVVAGLFRDLYGNTLDKNWQAAVEIDDSLRHLYVILAFEANPIPVKWALRENGTLRETYAVALAAFK